MPDVEFRTACSRIKDVDELAGKVIEAACAWDYGPAKLGIRFADGTYIYCEAEQGYEAAALSLDGAMYEDDAFQIGIIDQAELDRVKAAKRAEQEAREKARRDEIDRISCARMLAMMAERNQIDRPTYERMKAEYGV